MQKVRIFRARGWRVLFLLLTVLLAGVIFYNPASEARRSPPRSCRSCIPPLKLCRPKSKRLCSPLPTTFCAKPRISAFTACSVSCFCCTVSALRQSCPCICCALCLPPRSMRQATRFTRRLYLGAGPPSPMCCSTARAHSAGFCSYGCSSGRHADERTKIGTQTSERYVCVLFAYAASQPHIYISGESPDCMRKERRQCKINTYPKGCC